MRRVRPLVIVAVAAALVAAPAFPAAGADGVTEACRFDDARFTEISGMTYSQLHPGVLYLHNFEYDDAIIAFREAQTLSRNFARPGAPRSIFFHGSTDTVVDPATSLLFKTGLEARGIKPAQAQELLVFGFFEEVLGKIENQELHDQLSAVIRDKFKA